MKKEQRLASITNSLRGVGLREEITAVLATAVCEGAVEILGVHGSTKEKLKTVYKDDGTNSPQTIADLRSGDAIRSVIEGRYPNYQIADEEAGIKVGTGFGFRVDPLDGTTSFALGQRYSTVVAEGHVLGENLPIVAALVNPFEHELMVAEIGKGSFVFSLDKEMVPCGSGHILKVSPRTSLVGACGYIDALFNDQTTAKKIDFISRIGELARDTNGRSTWHMRVTGSNIDQQRQVAAGRADFGLGDARDPKGIHDFAGRLIVTEAGGIFTDQYGGPVTDNTQCVVYANAKIHDILVRVTSEIYSGFEGYSYKK